MKKIYSIMILTGIIIGAPSALAFERNFYSYDIPAAADSLDDNHDKVDTILPQMYEFRRDFKLHKINDGGVEEVARDHDIKITPLVFQENFDRTLMSAILLIKPLQEIIVEQMIEEAKDENYAGWQYDFENIAPGEGDHYTKFVEYSAREFDKAGLELSVAIVPRQSDYRAGIDDADWSAAYDLSSLAQAVDYVTLMAYDDPRSQGPAASYDFSKRTIEYALTKAPAEKLSLGIPLYCWKWYLTDGYRRRGAITHPLTDEDFEEAEAGLRGYNTKFESEWSIYKVASGNIYLTWCDGERGFEKKLDLVRQYDLRGFSAWAIGQEDQDIWDEL